MSKKNLLKFWKKNKQEEEAAAQEAVNGEAAAETEAEAEESVTEEPTAEETVSEEPASEESVPEEPVSEEAPAEDETPAQEDENTVDEEAAVDETEAETEESASEEAVIEETVSEESVTEEAATEGEEAPAEERELDIDAMFAKLQEEGAPGTTEEDLDNVSVEGELDIDALFAKLQEEGAPGTTEEDLDNVSVEGELDIDALYAKLQEQGGVTEAPAQPEYEQESYSMPQPEVTSNPETKEMAPLSFNRKMKYLVLAPAIAAVVILFLISISTIVSSLTREMDRSLEIAAASLESSISTQNDGSFTIDESGALKKGEGNVADYAKLLTSIKGNTGFELSVFVKSGNKQTRLITSLVGQDGASYAGTEMDPKIYAKIDAGETVFKKNQKIDKKRYYVRYQPLKDKTGKVLGAVAVASAAGPVNGRIAGKIIFAVIASALMLALVTVTILYMTKSMVKVMEETKGFLEILSKGDMSYTNLRVDDNVRKRNDELGEIYRLSIGLQSTYRDIVMQIKDSAQKLLDSARQLSEMAAGTTQTVEAVTLSLADVSEGSAEQTRDANDARENLLQVGEQVSYIRSEVDALSRRSFRMSDAEKAEEAILQQLNVSNEETISAITRVSDQFQALNKTIQSIKKATGVIQDIADETDLLSLNASIEAAKAGEAGRGFAVVAQQINALAEQSNGSAQEIESIIEGLLKESDEMVGTMKEMRKAINQQQEKLDETMEMTADVADGVSKSLESIESIRNKTAQLDQFSDAVVGVVDALTEVTRKNVATTDETMQNARGMYGTMNMLSGSADSLQYLTDELDKALARFTMD